jgi:hypothetical protein
MSGVLKKHLVRSAGTRVLGEAPAGESVVSTVSAPAAEGMPQARIVEQSNGVVVVEVVCECGRKIYLNCECRPS